MARPKRTPEERVAELRDDLGYFRSIVPTRIGSYDLSRRFKLPWKVSSLQCVLAHRLIDISEAALDLLEQKRTIPGLILTRAALETTALTYVLHKKLGEALQNDTHEELHGFVYSAALGSKDPTAKARFTNIFEAYNIKTAFKHLGKEFESVSSIYDFLCDFAHPNFLGGIGSYVRHEEHSQVIGANANGNAHVVGSSTSKPRW